jgi:type IV secretory pathway TrbD component
MIKHKPLGAPIHRSLTEPELVAGMERKPAIILFILAAAIVGGGGIDWYTLLEAALLLLGGGYALRRLAAYDPQFLRVIWRYSQYAMVYDAETPAETRRGFLARSLGPPPMLAGPQRPAVPARSEIE